MTLVSVSSLVLCDEISLSISSPRLGYWNPIPSKLEDHIHEHAYTSISRTGNRNEKKTKGISDAQDSTPHTISAL
ncbi:hypothetical protein BDR03DRAFT_127534 [Suillus americanus]|nr:hypothetical protein BDR03DRAFT_127534 [Suillus americanus]